MPITKLKTAVSPVYFKNDPVFRPDELIGKRAYRADEVEKLTVTVGGYTFDADEASMDRMGRVISVASWRCLQTIAQGVAPADAYASIFAATEVPWKLSNNVTQQIPIGIICEAQEQALYALSTVWVRYG